MTWQEALDQLAGHRAIADYRRLCADDWHDVPARDAYRRKVLRLAGGEVEPEPEPKPKKIPVRTSVDATRVGYRRCFYASHEGCGCSGTHCFWRTKIVVLRDCIECLKI